MLDALAEASNTVFTSSRYGAVAEMRHKGRTLVMLKPSTYMNLSGKAVRYWLEQERIPRENLLVVSDDIALPFGALRIRPKGSAGGHNGRMDRRGAQGAARTAEDLRRGDPFVRDDRVRTHDEPLQQEIAGGKRPPADGRRGRLALFEFLATFVSGGRDGRLPTARVLYIVA